jgi:5-methylcytosine-specific restriction endonuclease McrA
MTARKKSGGRRGGRSKRKSPYSAKQEHETSLPTSLNAYVETREWLLARHGPHCAYCGRKVAKATITLDHVAPRRGGDPAQLVAGASKAHSELGWRPRYPELATIIEHAWAWHQRGVQD